MCQELEKRITKFSLNAKKMYLTEYQVEKQNEKFHSVKSSRKAHGPGAVSGATDTVATPPGSWTPHSLHTLVCI